MCSKLSMSKHQQSKDGEQEAMLLCKHSKWVNILLSAEESMSFEVIYDSDSCNLTMLLELLLWLISGCQKPTLTLLVGFTGEPSLRALAA